MSLIALTSYATTLRQYTAPARSANNVQTTSTFGAIAEAQNKKTTLKDALPAAQLEQLEVFRDQKEAMADKLSSLQEAFAEASAGFGQNNQNDIDAIVEVGHQMFELIKSMQSVTEKVSDLLGQANPADADGISRGAGNKLYDTESLGKEVALTDEASAFMHELYDAYKATKTAAQTNGEKDVLNSPSMSKADMFGHKMVIWTDQLAKGAKTAAGNTNNTVSVVV